MTEQQMKNEPATRTKQQHRQRNEHAVMLEKDTEQAAPEKLLLWVLALGLKPDTGWGRVAGISNTRMKALGDAHYDDLSVLRVHQEIGMMLREEHLAALVKVRLAEQLLNATTAKELYEAVRVYEKLPKLAATMGMQTESASTVPALEMDADIDIEAAIAEARRMLDEIEAMPTTEDIAQLAEEGRSLLKPDSGDKVHDGK